MVGPTNTNDPKYNGRKIKYLENKKNNIVEYEIRRWGRERVEYEADEDAVALNKLLYERRLFKPDVAKVATFPAGPMLDIIKQEWLNGVRTTILAKKYNTKPNILDKIIK